MQLPLRDGLGMNPIFYPLSAAKESGSTPAFRLLRCIGTIVRVVRHWGWTNAGQVLAIPAIEDPLPLAGFADRYEGVTDLLRLRVQTRVLDAEFAHLPAALLGAVDLLRQADSARGSRRAARKGSAAPAAAGRPPRPGFAEDPRIADRTAGGGHAVDAGLRHHVQAIGGGEQVAAPQHGPRPGVPLDFAQELPAAGTDVALLHGAAMHGDRRHATGESAVENRVEIVAAVAVYRPGRGASSP